MVPSAHTAAGVPITLDCSAGPVVVDQTATDYTRVHDNGFRTTIRVHRCH